MSCASERGREALSFCSKAVLPQLQHFGGGSVYDRVQRGLRKAQHVQERELSPDVGLMEKWVQFLVCCTISYRTCPRVHFQNEGLSSYSSGRQLLGSSSFSFPCSWEVAFQTAASPLGKAVGNELLKRLFWDLISFKAFPLTFYFQGVGCSLDKAFCGWDFFFLIALRLWVSCQILESFQQRAMEISRLFLCICDSISLCSCEASFGLWEGCPFSFDKLGKTGLALRLLNYQNTR